MAFGLAAGLIGGGLLGGIGGTQGQSSSSTSGVRLGALDQYSQYAGASMNNQFRSLEELLQYGPGGQDVQNATNSGRAFSQQLMGYNGIPSQQDQQYAQQYTSQMFAPQQQSLNKAFQDQTIESNRLSARLGRRTDDGVLQGMLRGNMMNQQGALDAQRTAFGAQFAQQLPMQRFQVQSQGLDLQQQLSQQATANRQGLLELGQGIYNQGRQFQFNTAERYGTQNQAGPGFFAGALQGAASGAKIGSLFK